MSKPAAVKCSYCRVELDDNGAIANKGDAHGRDCADRPLEKSEIKRLFAYRDRSTGASQWSPWVPVGTDLLTVLDSKYLSVEVKELLSELATLVTMTDANHSTPTDRVRRGSSDGIPSFDPAAAERALEDAGRRLRVEVEKLAGVTRNPNRSPVPECEVCERRPRIVDVYCGPCAAQVLRDHRRT